MRLPVAEAPGEIWLKLENLQPIGSFKIRGATNAIRQASPEELAAGVVTASAGNMAQGVAWAAREAGVTATIVVPDHAPQTKIDAIERLGGRVIKVPHERWWQTMEEHRHEGVDGLFVHPVEDEQVMAGNGTIGLEVLEDLPDADAVVIPYGGGGLTAGIASAVKALRPETKVFTVEPETGAPFAASFAAGTEQTVEYTPSFVDGAGAPLVLPKMWGIDSRARRRRADGVAGRDGGGGAAARRARARDRGGCRRARGRGRARGAGPDRGRSSASCPAATSTPRGLATILGGETPS